MRQGTEEWKEARRKHIGASDAPAIMGVSPWKTPYQLWQQKLGLAPDDEMNPAMSRGVRLEPLALAWYERQTGVLMTDCVYFSEQYPWMMASMDGVSFDGQRAVEIKCPSQIGRSFDVPDHYMPQVQHQMFVTGLTEMDYVEFDGEAGMIIPVKRDDAFIGRLIEAEEAFYELMVTKTPPELTDRDYINRSADDEYGEIEAKLLASVRDRKAAEEEERRWKKLLEEKANGHNVRGRYTKFTKVVTSGRVNYSLIPELEGVDLDKYRGEPTSYYRLTELKNAKD